MNLPVLVGSWSGYWSDVRLAGSGLVLSPVSGWLVFALVSDWLILGLVLGLVSGWLVLGLVTRPDLSDWYCLVTRLLGAYCLKMSTKSLVISCTEFLQVREESRKFKESR